MTTLRTPAPTMSGSGTIKQMKGSFLMAKVTFSYGRGKSRNRLEDLDAKKDRGELTEDGQFVVLGLGTKVDARLRDVLKARAADEMRVRNALRRAFVAGPFEGTYIVPEQGAVQKFLAALDPLPRDDISVRVSEYTVGVTMQAPEQMREWSERVAQQLADLPTGRGKEVSVDAIVLLKTITACPLVSDKTRTVLEALIEDAKLDKVDRADFRRRLDAVKVEVDPGVPEDQWFAPRAVPRPSMLPE